MSMPPTPPFINRSIKRIKTSIDNLNTCSKNHENALTLMSNIMDTHEKSYEKVHQILDDLIVKLSKTVQKYEEDRVNYDTEIMSLSEDLSNITIQFTDIAKEIINLKSNICSRLDDIQMIKDFIHLEITLKYADLREEINKDCLHIKEKNDKNRDDINLLKGELEMVKNNNQKALDYTNRKFNNFEDKLENNKCCVIS